MVRWLTGIILVLTSWTALAGGGIAGKIEPAPRVKGVAALSRSPREIMAVADRKQAARFDSTTGEFSISDLAPGTYDLVIEVEKAIIEGVDLRLPKEKPPFYDLKLEPDELTVTGLDPARDLGQPTFDSPEEKEEAVRRFFRLGGLQARLESLLKVESFTDKVRALYIHGNATNANVLMELARVQPFHSESGNEVIWRVEVWPMKWYYGAWDKGRYYVIDRQRLSQAACEATGRFFDPHLGGIDVAEGETTRVDYRIPDPLDRRMGKPVGVSF